MDSDRLGDQNLWAWLVRLLSKKPEWLSAKVRFFLPTADLDCSNEASNPDVTRRQLSRLFAQGPATWKSFIYTLCFELDVPLELEVRLLNNWGQKDGKGSHRTGLLRLPAQPCGVESYRTPSDPSGHTERT